LLNRTSDNLIIFSNICGISSSAETNRYLYAFLVVREFGESRLLLLLLLRTMMLAALERPELVDRLAVVDVSPVNKVFDVTDATEWNMEHYFHSMLAVEFAEGVNISQCRRNADAQGRDPPNS
jgi:hypothetical protein